MMRGGLPTRAIGILGLGMFGQGLAVGGFGAYVTVLVAGGVSPGVAGFGSTLFLLGQLLAVLPIDVLSRRWPVRYVAGVGMFLGAAGTALGGVLTIEIHLLGRLLLGIGTGAAFLTVMKYGGLRAEGEAVARTQGLIGALFTLGLAVGIATMPSAVDQLGPVLPSVLAAIPVALSGLLALSLVPVTGAPIPDLAAYLEPFGNAVGLSLGLANAVSYGFLVVAVTWYTDIIAGNPALPATLVLTGFAVATFVGRTGSGWLTAVATERRSVGGSLAFLTVSLALVAAALALGASAFLAVALVLTGLGFGLPFGPLFSLAFESKDSDAGVLLVGMTALGNAGAVIYPWLVGQLLSLTDSYVVGFVVMSVSVLLVTILWRRALYA